MEKMAASIINSISSHSAISNITFQQFHIYEWVWILIFILVLVIVWALLSSAASNANDESTELIDRIEEEPVHHSPDDLTRIEGIGPKINLLLNNAGIFTFQQLAYTNVIDLQNILNSAGLRTANPASWPQQAGLAADQHWDDLASLQKSLKGGR